MVCKIIEFPTDLIEIIYPSHLFWETLTVQFQLPRIFFWESLSDITSQSHPFWRYWTNWASGSMWRHKDISLVRPYRVRKTCSVRIYIDHISGAGSLMSHTCWCVLRGQCGAKNQIECGHMQYMQLNPCTCLLTLFLILMCLVAHMKRK